MLLFPSDGSSFLVGEGKKHKPNRGENKRGNVCRLSAVCCCCLLCFCRCFGNPGKPCQAGARRVPVQGSEERGLCPTGTKGWPLAAPAGERRLRAGHGWGHLCGPAQVSLGWALASHPTGPWSRAKERLKGSWGQEPALMVPRGWEDPASSSLFLSG